MYRVIKVNFVSELSASCGESTGKKKDFLDVKI